MKKNIPLVEMFNAEHRIVDVEFGESLISIEESLALVVSILEDCDIQHQSEIDERYVEDKAGRFYDIAKKEAFTFEEVVVFLRQIISDAQRVKK